MHLLTPPFYIKLTFPYQCSFIINYFKLFFFQIHDQSWPMTNQAFWRVSTAISKSKVAVFQRRSLPRRFRACLPYSLLTIIRRDKLKVTPSTIPFGRNWEYVSISWIICSFYSTISVAVWFSSVRSVWNWTIWLSLEPNTIPTFQFTEFFPTGRSVFSPWIIWNLWRILLFPFQCWTVALSPCKSVLVKVGEKVTLGRASSTVRKDAKSH